MNFLCVLAGCLADAAKIRPHLFLREIGYRKLVVHIGEDDLERYAMRTLPESACATLEEHLLICAGCRDRLQTMDEYVTAMRSAAVKIRKIRITGKKKAAQG